MCLHYFELPKLSGDVDAEDELKLWLMLFRAKTEEDLMKIEALGVSVMEQVIGAYRHISTTDEFKEKERLRSLARHNEAAALRHATEVEREKWQGVVAERDIAHAAALAEKETAHAAVLAEKDTQIAELLARLGENL